MNVLFIHQNFPGQFVHLAADLAKDKKNKVVALTIDQRPAPAGVIVRPYTLLRSPAQETHFLLQDQEGKVLRGEACAAAALQLKRDGFEPDLIIAHPGWGEALFMKDVFPRAKLVIYCEYYYAAEGQDVGFDPEQPPLTFTQRCQLRLKNTTNLLSMEIADAAISPTEWQKSTYPAWAQEKITVIHDGIDLKRLKFDPEARLKIGTRDGSQAIEFRPGDEVLSYVARNLEPVRGFHVFMRTLPEVLRQRPNARAIVVGGNEVSYGQRAPGGLSWKEHMLKEVGGELNLSRVHFVGQVSYDAYLQLLSISRVHTYWTTPFVLSWSFLEAAASGLPVIASDTVPVREFADQLQVQTVDFFGQQEYAAALVAQLAKARRNAPASDRSHLSLPRCLKRQREWLSSI
ncbi:glycosyltransferase [Pseudoduganella namucuonensis]|uniref:Glycosyltransferase involved in cell wall bisynthesis n=1 Tax=Pseudoduganella namucuonensis TaxID=1035707 RepID=A0A1I7L0I9_9BURK|nr:glycosyltransferase [Pseudoduganella namucuonensis]SFV03165.1 Glycosyltransferase involved in cell wall bisynthesis [Pseudoduganella namucuonensis]